MPIRPLSDKEIGRMQAAVESSPDVLLFPDSPTATVSIVTTADDGMGGSTSTTTVLATNRRCLVRMLRNTSGQESSVGGQPISATGYEIDLEPGTPAPLGATITIAAIAYEITALIAPVTYVPSVRVIARRIA